MDLGAPELMIILVIAILLFGANKLPDLARGSGRALRIFKDELKDPDEAGADVSVEKAVVDQAPPPAAD